MEEILEALRDGDHSIVDVFVEANALWREIMSDFDTVPVSDL